MPPNSHPFMIVQDMLKLRGEICKICKNFDKSHVCAQLALSSWQYIRISTNREQALPERAWSFRLDMEDHDKRLTSSKQTYPQGWKDGGHQVALNIGCTNGAGMYGQTDWCHECHAP